MSPPVTRQIPWSSGLRKNSGSKTMNADEPLAELKILSKVIQSVCVAAMRVPPRRGEPAPFAAPAGGAARETVATAAPEAGGGGTGAAVAGTGGPSVRREHAAS